MAFLQKNWRKLALVLLPIGLYLAESAQLYTLKDCFQFIAGLLLLVVGIAPITIDFVNKQSEKRQ